MSNKGKGLKSLLGDSDLVVKRKISDFAGVKEIELTKISAGASQPRQHFDEQALQQLSESIKLHGLIQPITVRKSGDEYHIISGERRFRASQMAGLKSIPAYIRDVNDQRMLEMALIENIQRENLNPIEVALSYRRMIEELDFRQEDLAQRLSKSRTSVTNTLRLLNLPTEIQSGLILGVVTSGQVRPLIPLDNNAFQMEIYGKILDENLSSREVEALVKRGNTFDEQASDLERYKEDIRIEEMTLKGKTRVPFNIKVKEINKGSVAIKFADQDELNYILTQLSEEN